METLLKPGDMIRIRADIEEGKGYKMILNKETTNSWIADDMLPAGTLVKIVNISSDQYVVNPIDYERDKKFYDDESWLYTDEMFDPETLAFLIGAMIEEDYF